MFHQCQWSSLLIVLFCVSESTRCVTVWCSFTASWWLPGLSRIYKVETIATRLRLNRLTWELNVGMHGAVI